MARREVSLAPVAAVFVLFGTFWGGWAVAAADVERALGMSHGGFGLLLSIALGAAAVANAVGGAAAERWGTASVLAGSLAAWAGLLLAGAATGRGLPFALLLIGVVAMGGVVDVVMNVAATAGLSDAPGALVRFHARFNIGAAVGAAAVGVLLANDASWRWAWNGVGLAALVLAAVCVRAQLPAGEAGEQAPLTGALGLLRREGLLLVASAFAVGAMVEGGIELWGVLFLRTHLSSGVALGATSAAIAYGVAAAARLLLGSAAGRRGTAAGVALGAATAAVGIVVLAFAPVAWMAGAGLVLGAGGISMCWPLLLAHATAGRDRPGAVVGAVSAIGYLGFVVGPSVVGWLAEVVGLRVALLVLALAAVFVAGAPSASRRREPVA